MPNWCQSTLTFIVPTKNKNAFLAAIEGPADWPLPAEVFHSFEIEKTKLSNHQEIELERKGIESDEMVAEFKSFMKPSGWPEWMPPSRTDMVRFALNPENIKFDTVPFSVATIAPWEGPEEFERFFGKLNPDVNIWTEQKTKNNLSSPVIELRNQKIGPKWPPSDIDMEVDNASEKTRIVITYSTPWGPIENPGILLDKVCREHGAKFLLAWVEEQGLCGYTYFDPASGNDPREVDFGFEHNWMREVADENSPEDTWSEFDYEAFKQDVGEEIGDADF